MIANEAAAVVHAAVYKSKACVAGFRPVTRTQYFAGLPPSEFNEAGAPPFNCALARKTGEPRIEDLVFDLHRDG